jgi:hypothetical protein
LRGESALNIYSIALFIHVISTIANFFGNGTLLLAIVFLMTTKPTLIGSILVMAIAVVLGLASGLPLARAKRGSRRQER